MRIVVTAKYVPDINTERGFDDGRVVRNAGEGTLNELDENAIEAALQLVEAERESGRIGPSDGEVVVVTMAGPDGDVALRKAFQLGVDRGIRVSDDALAGSDYFGTAAVLAAAVRKLGEEAPVDLVVTGMAALDGLGSVVPTLLGAELGLPTLNLAKKVELAGGVLTITREIDDATEQLSGAAARRPVRDGRGQPAALPGLQAHHGRPQQGDRGVVPGRPRARPRRGGQRRRPHRDAVGGPPAAAPRGGARHRQGRGRRGAGRLPDPQRPGLREALMTNRTVLVLLDPATEVRTSTLELLTIARGLGRVEAVTLEAPTVEVLAQLGAYGVETVHQAEPARDGACVSGDERHLPAVVAAALAAAVRLTDADVVLLPTSFAAKEAAALAAHELGAGLVIDAASLRDVDGRIVAGKRVFAGSWDTECAVTTDVAVVTVRANSAVAQPVAAAVEPVTEGFAVEVAAVPGGAAVPRGQGRHERPAAAGPGGRSWWPAGAAPRATSARSRTSRTRSALPSARPATRRSRAGGTPTWGRPASRSPRASTSAPASRARRTTAAACRRPR